MFWATLAWSWSWLAPWVLWCWGGVVWALAMAWHALAWVAPVGWFFREVCGRHKPAEG